MKLKINGRKYNYFNQISIALTLDSVASAFSFSAKFNPDNPEHKDLFRPLSYPVVEIFNNSDKLLLTGAIVSHKFNSGSNPKLLQVSGYSISGKLEDVTIPTNAYPLESNNRSLKNIADKLVNIFGLRCVVDPSVTRSVNLIYKKTEAQPSDTVKSYLSKLAAQRNIVLSHNEKGDVVLYRPNTNKEAVYFFTPENTLEMGLTTNGQSLHSTVCVIRQPSEDNPHVVLEDKANNQMIKEYRPMVHVLSSGSVTDTKHAADNKRASELKNITVMVKTNTFLDIRPSDIVEIQNKEIYLYTKTRFLVNGIKITESETGTLMSLTMVLPETYTGKQPKNIFES